MNYLYGNPMSIERSKPRKPLTTYYPPNPSCLFSHVGTSTYYLTPPQSPHVHGPSCSGAMCGIVYIEYVAPPTINPYYSIPSPILGPLVYPNLSTHSFPHGNFMLNKTFLTNPTPTTNNGKERKIKE